MQRTLPFVLITLLASSALAASPARYFPPAGAWEHIAPAEAGLDPAGVAAAVQHAIDNESKDSRDLTVMQQASFGREPMNEPLGPLGDRGAPTGTIVRHGRIVAEWGEPERVSATFSVTKSFLSTVVGVAIDRGKIPDVNSPVRELVQTEHFASDRHARITWDHLLRQTSDWEGTLWGKPDWADRPPRDVPIEEHKKRVHGEPGAAYKYNDTRVNLLALAALHVWRKPLPDVLRESIMEPIGASSTWAWHGYSTSWTEIDGKRVQSVSGGAHFGGGMFIDARDMARFGLLTLHRGRWGNRQLLSEKWVAQALTPTDVQPTYGYMNWFLNTDQKLYPAAPASAFVHTGAGSNLIYVDPEHDIVAVVRWIDGRAMNGFIEKLLGAVME
ncbi:MAG TPA: serine hydrolase [Opitutaceae bacterium]|nr:serine hydrolase [Opitutaceae bacterium]